MPDLGPILANLVSMDLESFWGFDQRERFKAFRFYLRPSHRLSILFFFSPSFSPFPFPLSLSLSITVTLFNQETFEQVSVVIFSNRRRDAASGIEIDGRDVS